MNASRPEPGTHNLLRRIARKYVRQEERRDRALCWGDEDKANEAISVLQEIEDNVIVIVRPGFQI